MISPIHGLALCLALASLFALDARLAAATGYDPEAVRIARDAAELVSRVNEFRAEHDLDPVPLSKALTYTAQLHVEDLVVQDPVNLACSAHSWSEAGDWKPCCVSHESKHAKCSRSKPKELTSFDGQGYEMYATIKDADIKPEQAFFLLKEYEQGDMLLGRGRWKNLEYRSMGAAIMAGFALVWIGDDKDADGAPEVE